jgi:hypothetical protein
MPPEMPATAKSPAVTFRGVTEELLEALAGTFLGGRLFAAFLGMAVTLVIALSLGAFAGTLLLKNLLGEAALVAIASGFVFYAGLLLTFGALCRMAAYERNDETITAGAAFGFAFSRSHVIVGLPLFALLVALGLIALGARIGYATGNSDVTGSTLGPLVLAILCVINLVLLIGVLLTHALAAPCVACAELDFSAVGARLIRIAQERIHEFLAYQTAILVVGLPMIVFMTVVFAVAFQPSFYAVARGRVHAEAARQEAVTPPATAVEPTAPARSPVRALRYWVGSEVPAAGGAPLVGVAAMALLLLGIVPLVFAAQAQTAAYLGLSGDRCLVGAATPPVRAAEAVSGLPERRPPIVHCWACDAINRFETRACAKCGVALTVCPYCFATNQAGRTTCSSCGRPLTAEGEPAEEPEPATRAV